MHIPYGYFIILPYLPCISGTYGIRTYYLILDMSCISCTCQAPAFPSTTSMMAFTMATHTATYSCKMPHLPGEKAIRNLAGWLTKGGAPVRVLAGQHLLQVVAKARLLHISRVLLTSAWPSREGNCEICRPEYSWTSLVSKTCNTHALDMAATSTQTPLSPAESTFNSLPTL